MSKDTSGPAFPRRDEQGDGSHIQHFGLSKREYFAGLAMQGLMPLHWHREYAVIAEMAFAMADAMIAEGNK